MTHLRWKSRPPTGIGGNRLDTLAKKILNFYFGIGARLWDQQGSNLFLKTLPWNSSRENHQGVLGVHHLLEGLPKEVRRHFLPPKTLRF